MKKRFNLNFAAFLLVAGLLSISSHSKACPALEVTLTPPGIDCNLDPYPLATVTIEYNSCMASNCDGDIDYLVEVLNSSGNPITNAWYITTNLVSTFSPCGVGAAPKPGCNNYKVRVTMRCDGVPIPSSGMSDFKQACW